MVRVRKEREVVVFAVVEVGRIRFCRVLDRGEEFVFNFKIGLCY